MVLISGTISLPDGSPYIGSVEFMLTDLGVDSNTLYLPTVISVNSEGVVEVDLWPNTRSLQSTYYRCSLDNGSVFNISIPDEEPSYGLGAVILLDPTTLEPGILKRLGMIEASVDVGLAIRVSSLESYTGIGANRIPGVALEDTYPMTIVGTALKVDKVLTFGDGLVSGQYQGNQAVTLAVDGTVIRSTDPRLTDARDWVAPLVPIAIAQTGIDNTRYAWSALRVRQAIESWYANSGITQGITSVNSKVGPHVVLDKLDIGLGNVPNVDTSNAANITSGKLNPARLTFGDTGGTVVEGNDSRLSNSREWSAITAPLEVVSQPTNTTRYAWTPQRIWDALLSWFSGITADDIPEGDDNLYYLDARVDANTTVATNTAKLATIEAGAQVNTVASVNGFTGSVTLDKTHIGLSNVPNLDTSNATNITAGLLSGDRLSYGTASGTPAQGNDPRFSDSREWVADTVNLLEAQEGVATTRRAWTSQRVRNNVSFYTQPFTVSEKSKLGGIESNAQVNTVTSVSGRTGAITLTKTDVGLSSVPNIDTSNASNITTGTLGGARLSYGTVAGTPAQGNDSRFTDSREWSAATVSLADAQAGTSTTRYAWTSQRVRDNVAFYTQPFTSAEKTKLSELDSTNYLAVGATAANSQLLDSLDSTQFLRSDTPGVANSRIVYQGSQLGSIAGATGGGVGGLEVRASDFTTHNAAFMAFHKLGYAAYLGLDADSQFKVGGWSMGAVAYKLWHEGNLIPSITASNNTIVQRNGSGFIYANYFNTTPNDVTTGVTQVCVETGNDGFIRHGSRAAIQEFIGATATSTPNVPVMRDSAGDIYARLFRSEYAVTNPSINFIMTQISTAADNFIRPSTPTQFRAAVTDGVYLPIAGKAADSTLWDGWARATYLNQGVTTASSPTFSGLVITGVSPTVRFQDTDHRSFWLHSNSNRFYILSDNTGSGGWTAPFPALWDDVTQKCTFWSSEVLTANTGIRKDIQDTVSVNTVWADNYSLNVGTSLDHRIFHNGTDTYHDNYTGHLYSRSFAHGKNVYFQAEDTGGVNRALCYMHPDAGVNLYYQGVEKFKTTASGISVNNLDLTPEVGTFTPKVYSTGDPTTEPTYTLVVARYSKIGSRVWFYLDITCSTTLPTAGFYRVSGLPYPAVSLGASARYEAFTVGFVSNFSYTGILTSAINHISGNSELYFWVTNNGVSTQLTNTAMLANSRLFISGSYEV